MSEKDLEASTHHHRKTVCEGRVGKIRTGCHLVSKRGSKDHPLHNFNASVKALWLVQTLVRTVVGA